MTSGKLVAHSYLTFLRNINLCHLKNAGRKLVTYGNGELSALQFGIKKLILAYIVHYELLDELIGVRVVCPSVRLDAVILEVLEYRSSKLAALCDNLRTGIILHTLRNLILSENKQFLYKNILKIVVLCLIFLVYLSEQHLVLFLRLTCLDSTGEHLLVNHHTTE